jgi:hypothetical protein
MEEGATMGGKENVKADREEGLKWMDRLTRDWLLLRSGRYVGPLLHYPT